MKKLIVLLVVLIMATTACGNNQNSEEKEAIQKQEVKPKEEIKEAETAKIKETSDKEVEIIEEQKQEEPTEEVKKVDNEKKEIEFDISNYENEKGEEINDEAVSNKLKENLEYLFFNYCFRNNIEDDGNITSLAMVTSAISYIMQYEFSELKFDYETYILYIPKQQVKTIIYKFFGKDIPKEDYVVCDLENINYDEKNEMYEAKVQDGTFDNEVKIKKVLKYEDDCFKVIAKAEDVNITAYFKKIALNYVLVNYKED